MRNKSKNRIKHEMRIKMRRLEEDNRLLLKECRHIREMREMYYEKWINNCPKFVFNPSEIVPICSRITILKDDFDIINGNKDSVHWLKERLLSDALKSIIGSNLFTFERINNVYEATVFLAVPTAIPSEKYTAHIYGDFESGDNRDKI